MNFEVSKLFLDLPKTVRNDIYSLEIKEYGQACYDEGYLQGQKDAETVLTYDDAVVLRAFGDLK